MSAIRLYTDEDVTDLLARTLHGRGFDAVSVHEAGTKATSDAEQLAFAVAQERTFLTFNVRDFVLLHQEYLAEGKPHFGIIVGTQESFSELLRRVLKLLAALQAEDMPNRLEWLNNYK